MKQYSSLENVVSYLKSKKHHDLWKILFIIEIEFISKYNKRFFSESWVFSINSVFLYGVNLRFIENRNVVLDNEVFVIVEKVLNIKKDLSNLEFNEYFKSLPPFKDRKPREKFDILNYKIS